MNDFLNKDLKNTVYGFAGIYGVEINSHSPNYVTKEMEEKCNDEIWIMVENNYKKENKKYNYKLKCLCCGREIEVDKIEQCNVIIPIIKEK